MEYHSDLKNSLHYDKENRNKNGNETPFYCGSLICFPTFKYGYDLISSLGLPYPAFIKPYTED
jgi:hypothetical protein